MNPIIIIQVRVDSERLYAKALLPILDESSFAWCVRRCLRTGYSVIVATPKDKINSYIWRWCEREGITLFKGSKNNVLKRYYDCAKRFKVDTIIRITADCPFINPDIIKKLVSLYKGKPLMFDKRQGWGVEIFSFEDLESMFKKYKFDEHVTSHLNPKIINFPCQSVVPLELNTRQDYERLCTLAPSYRA